MRWIKKFGNDFYNSKIHVRIALLLLSYTSFKRSCPEQNVTRDIHVSEFMRVTTALLFVKTHNIWLIKELLILWVIDRNKLATRAPILVTTVYDCRQTLPAESREYIPAKTTVVKTEDFSSLSRRNLVNNYKYLQPNPKFKLKIFQPQPNLKLMRGKNSKTT